MSLKKNDRPKFQLCVRGHEGHEGLLTQQKFTIKVLVCSLECKLTAHQGFFRIGHYNYYGTLMHYIPFLELGLLYIHFRIAQSTRLP